jgi:hypothetical protein
MNQERQVMEITADHACWGSLTPSSWGHTSLVLQESPLSLWKMRLAMPNPMPTVPKEFV